MFVTNPRASAWLDPRVGGGKGGAAVAGRQRDGISVQTLYAVRPFETPVGRCIALKLVSRRDASPRFFVLFESRYERVPRPQWVPVEQALSETDVERWAVEGFQK